jgi:hypothetical protein
LDDASIFESLSDIDPSIWFWLTVESIPSTVPRLLGRQTLERTGDGAALGWRGMIEPHPEGAVGRAL